MCVSTLNEITQYFVSLGSPIYLYFMDSSKAFDKVNHWHLLNKLLHRGIPFKWNDTHSMKYSTENEISYNATKTVCMYIRPKHMYHIGPVEQFLYGHELRWVDENMYQG